MYALLFVPQMILEAGAMLCGAVLIYLLLVHAWPRWQSGKEWAVAAIFASGVALSPLAEEWAASGDCAWCLPAAGLFVFLCWINCEGIERWSAARGSVALPCALAALVSMIFAAYQPAFGLAALLSAAALGLLDRRSRQLHPELVRVSADLALLTPLLILPFLFRG
jgi:hypothetical protein